MRRALLLFSRRLSFPNTEERALFQEKLISLCAETKKMNHPQEEEVRLISCWFCFIPAHRSSRAAGACMGWD